MSNMSKINYLENSSNNRIMTCGELNDINFTVLDTDLESFSNRIDNINHKNNLKDFFKDSSLFKGTKKGNNELNASSVDFNYTNSIKIRPGSRILKVENEQQYRELIERYSNKESYADENVVGVKDISYLNIDLLKQNYEGIYLSKDISIKLDQELNNLDKSSNRIANIDTGRVIILNSDALANIPVTKVKPLRKGVSGKVNALSTLNRKFSEEVYKNIKYYSKLNRVFHQAKIPDLMHIKEGKCYLDGINISTKVRKYFRDYENINKFYNIFNGSFSINVPYNNSEADLETGNITYGFELNRHFFNFYMCNNPKLQNLNIQDKIEIFKNIGEATILHELGHVNNNSLREASVFYHKVKDNLIFDKKTNEYYVDKKYALEYMQDILHTERLAWDYAFKQKPDCPILKEKALIMYSSYVVSHMHFKKAGYFQFSLDDKDIRVNFR